MYIYIYIQQTTKNNHKYLIQKNAVIQFVSYIHVQYLHIVYTWKLELCLLLLQSIDVIVTFS